MVAVLQRDQPGATSCTRVGWRSTKLTEVDALTGGEVFGDHPK